VTQAIRAVDATHFEADATLTIRDKTVALKFPFAFEPNADGARLKARVTLDRLAFGIGSGDWADASMIGHQVEVNVDLSLVRKS
jgi:polyisoprenoid-binding protein YceI